MTLRGPPQALTTPCLRNGEPESVNGRSIWPVAVRSREELAALETFVGSIEDPWSEVLAKYAAFLPSIKRRERQDFLTHFIGGMRNQLQDWTPPRVFTSGVSSSLRPQSAALLPSFFRSPHGSITDRASTLFANFDLARGSGDTANANRVGMWPCTWWPRTRR